AHNESRQNYNEIADEYFEAKINGEPKVDVMLGGGTDYFVREDRNRVEEFQEAGYHYVTTRDDMLKNESETLLGLFAPVGLPKCIDRENRPSLHELNGVALYTVSKNQDRFFLMMEGRQINWPENANDSVGAMREMENFAQAFKTVIESAENDKHTRVVL